MRVPSGGGQLRDGPRALRRPLDPECSRVPLDVVLGYLELMRGDRSRFRANLLQGSRDRLPAHARRPRAVCVHAEARYRGVAVQHLDVVGRDTESVGDDLRPRGVMTLAVRRCSGAHDDLAIGTAFDLGRVPAARHVAQRPQDLRRREAAHLDVAGEADAELLRVFRVASGLLFLAELFVLGKLERAIERRHIVGGIDVEAHDRRDRLLGRRQEVLAPHHGRIHVDAPCERVDEPFDHERRLGSPGSAVGVGRRGVRHDARELVPIGLGVIWAHVHPASELGDTRRQQLEVRAHVRQLDELHAQDLTVVGPSQRAIVQHPAAMDGRDVVLLSRLDPFHGTAQRPREGEG